MPPTGVAQTMISVWQKFGKIFKAERQKFMAWLAEQSNYCYSK